MKVDPAVIPSFVIPVLGLDNFTLSLKCMLCIYYPLRFRKNKSDKKVLINFGSEVNAMTPAYTKKVGL